MIELIRNSNWTKEFADIKAYLQKGLGDINIEHVGSTSIHNLLAKPIIDIDIVIDNINQMPEINQKLESLGYRLQGDLGVIGRYAYLNPKVNLYKHHLYLCISNENGYLEHQIFKNYLLIHPDKCREYEELKSSLCKLNISRDDYCDGKTSFIKECLKLSGYQEVTYNKVSPDFSNSLINITSSIQKHFGFASNFSSLPNLDAILKDSKHVVLLLLDGMGKNILENNLSSNSFLRRHWLTTLTSVFPPTTVAATTALQSGVLPGESGWIGWQQYFEKVDRNLILFRNTDYYNNEVVEDDLINEEIGFIPFASKFEHPYQLFPDFKVNGFKDFEILCNKIKEITNLNEKIILMPIGISRIP